MKALKSLLFVLVFGGVANAADYNPVRVTPYDTAVTTFQSGHGFTKSASGTGGDDTAIYAIGTQSLKSTTDGAGTATYWTKTGLSLNLTGKYIKVLVRCDNGARAQEISLYATGDNFSTFYVWSVGSDRHRIIDNQWQMVTVPFNSASVTGSPSRSSINQIRVRARDTGAGAMNVWWGGVWTSNEPTAGVVSFAFDDGWSTQYTEGASYLATKGFSASLYTISEYVDGTNFITSAQLAALKNTYNWTFGVHGPVNWTGVSSSALTTHINAEKAFLLARGLISDTTTVGAAYPNGGVNSDVLTTVGPLLKFARTTENYNESYSAADLYMLRHVNIINTTTVASIKARIDNAKNNKEWAILTFHKIATPADEAIKTTIADFREIVDYVATQGLTVKTVEQVVADTTATLSGHVSIYNSVQSGMTVSGGALSTTTDTNGDFSFSNLYAGTNYSLGTTLSGYSCATQTGTIAIANTITIPCTTDWSGVSTFETARGTLVSATSTTAKLASTEKFPDGYFRNRASLCIVSGTGAGQCRVITDYNSYTQTATVAPVWDVTPNSTSGYVLDTRIVATIPPLRNYAN